MVEFASLYFYESSNHVLKTFNLVLNSAPLSKFVGNTESIYKLKIVVYEHQMQIYVNTTPKILKNLLLEAINTHPYNVEFLKNYLELNRAFNMRYFLQTNIGNGFYIYYL